MSRYNNISVERVKDVNLPNGGSRYYVTNYYPRIPLASNDLYAITDFGDRLDKLANQFYGDSSLYWVIASANPNVVQPGSLSLRGGIQLRIPRNISDILTQYDIDNAIGSSIQSNSGTVTRSVSSVGRGRGGY